MDISKKHYMTTAFLLASSALLYWMHGGKDATPPKPVTQTSKAPVVAKPANASHLQPKREISLSEKAISLRGLSPADKAQKIFQRMEDKIAHNQISEAERDSLITLLSEAGGNAEKLGFNDNYLRFEMGVGARLDTDLYLNTVESLVESGERGDKEVQAAEKALDGAVILGQFYYRGPDGIHVQDPYTTPEGEELKSLKKRLESLQFKSAQNVFSSNLRQAENSFSQGDVLDYMQRSVDALETACNTPNGIAFLNDSVVAELQKSLPFQYEQALIQAYGKPEYAPDKMNILREAERLEEAAKKLGLPLKDIRERTQELYGQKHSQNDWNLLRFIRTTLSAKSGKSGPANG